MKIYDQQLAESLQAKEARTLQKRQTLYKRTTVQQSHLILKHLECR